MDWAGGYTDYKALGLKVGLEIHQQLATYKLFCSCPSELTDSEAGEFTRMLRPTQSELGEVDRAALMEARKNLTFRYQAPPPSMCLVEADEEPPHEVNSEALDIALELACMVDARPVAEVQFMRKIVIDGSNTAGFQRTGLVALGGKLSTGDGENGEIGITTICLEEDAARRAGENAREVIYRLDRLGIPLIEITTEPDITTPEQAREVAEKIGALLRATKKVKRGIGSVREDVNISIAEGARVEIKGIQELKMMAFYVEEEVRRQLRLIAVKSELARRGVKKEDLADTRDVTGIFKNTESKIFQNMLKKGGMILGIRLKGFSGLLGHQFTDSLEGESVEDGRRVERSTLGPEMACYIRTVGLMGLFHSDELPGYGITKEEVDAVNKALNMDPLDGYVLIAEKEDKVREAGEIIISRARIVLDGVPGETRDPQPDGTTRYSRPLPGKARMYPETDVPPIRITDGRLDRIGANLPEMPEQKLERFITVFGLSREQAGQLLTTGRNDLFEELITKHAEKRMQKVIARTLLNTLPELEAEGVDTSTVDGTLLNGLFEAVGEGKFAKEGISEVLKHMIEEDVPVKQALFDLKLGGISREEMEKVIESVINERMEVVKKKGMAACGPLMGAVMKELRGKMDGKTVNDAVKKKIREILDTES
ncbi:MAG: Glu-tRNA(Gln) amidotransferase subunit GatE [Thermoplasmata archaeon]|nr:MAG: Glu-tRNA(Gln) amidotransferase subunit GatE [Thermoplasmata archaeon]